MTYVSSQYSMSNVTMGPRRILRVRVEWHSPSQHLSFTRLQPTELDEVQRIDLRWYAMAFAALDVDVQQLTERIIYSTVNRDLDQYLYSWIIAEERFLREHCQVDASFEMVGF